MRLGLLLGAGRLEPGAVSEVHTDAGGVGARVLPERAPRVLVLGARVAGPELADVGAVPADAGGLVEGPAASGAEGRLVGLPLEGEGGVVLEPLGIVDGDGALYPTAVAEDVGCDRSPLPSEEDGARDPGPDGFAKGSLARRSSEAAAIFGSGVAVTLRPITVR